MSTHTPSQIPNATTRLPLWAAKYTEYGVDDPGLERLISSYATWPMEVEVQETNTKSKLTQQYTIAIVFFVLMASQI